MIKLLLELKLDNFFGIIGNFSMWVGFNCECIIIDDVISFMFIFEGSGDLKCV